MKENEGNYEPGNLRWATRTEQNRNTRQKRLENFSYAALMQELARRIPEYGLSGC